MSKYKDITNERFGKLVVINRAENKRRDALWLCKCDCGKFITVKTFNLNSGLTKSCGCLKNKNCHKKYNQYKITGDVVIGLDSNGKTFTFDLADYAEVKKYTWLVDKSGYASTTIYSPHNNKTLQLHRLIMSRKDNFIVDHINRNPSDNRKINLRYATHSENGANSKIPINNISGVIGVSQRKDTNKWIANITVNYKRKFLGQFDTKEEAIAERLKGETKYFKEFAPMALNES